MNATPEAALPDLSRFEANLVRILRYFLRRYPAGTAAALIYQTIPRPTCLSRTAVRLVEDTLAKGVPLWLARAGGWRYARHLRHGQRVAGRLWERTPPRDLGLTFSRQSMELLLWFTAENPLDQRAQRWRPDPAQLTPGDELLFLLALGGVLPKVPAALLHKLNFVELGLCRLFYPDQFGPLQTEAPFSFARWTDGVGACVLEALQPELVERWLEVERAKTRLTDGSAMQLLGREQERVLTAFLDAVENAGRLDLARFLLRVSAELLTPGVTARRWLGGLRDPGTRLADRAATHRAALVVLHVLERLRRWSQRARMVSYFDETYEASQLWQADWEHARGEALWADAQRLLREVEPL